MACDERGCHEKGDIDVRSETIEFVPDVAWTNAKTVAIVLMEDPH
jgi:hypothetical protein